MGWLRTLASLASLGRAEGAGANDDGADAVDEDVDMADCNDLNQGAAPCEEARYYMGINKNECISALVSGFRVAFF